MKKIAVLFLFQIFYSFSFSQATDSIVFPRVVDLKPFFTSVKNQGDRDACSFFATIALVESEFKKVYQQEVNLSEQIVCYNAKMNYSEFAQSEYSSAEVNLWSVMDFGLLYESQWPYHLSFYNRGYPCGDLSKEDTNGAHLCHAQYKPSLNISSKIFKGNFNYGAILSNADTVVRFIATQQKPVSITFPLSHGNWSDSGVVFYNAQMDSVDRINGKAYHIAVISGYDLNKKVFFIRNSWGDDWGNEGYGTLSFDDFNQYEPDDSVFYFILNKPQEFVLPTEENITKPSLKYFDVSVHEKINKSLAIDINAEVNHLNNKNIELRSILILLPENTNDSAAYENVKEELTLSQAESELFNNGYARVVWTYFPDSNSSEKTVWDKKNTIRLSLPRKMILSESVQKALHRKGMKLCLQITLYYIDDIHGKVKMKRVFAPVNKRKLSR